MGFPEFFCLILLGLFVWSFIWLLVAIITRPDYFNISYISWLNNLPGRILFTIALLLMPIFGCRLSSHLFQTVIRPKEIDVEGWTVLKKPPQALERLKAMTYHTVYAQTVDGQVLSCHYESPYDEECWVEITKIPDTNIFNCTDWYSPPTFAEKPASVQVVDRVDIKTCTSFAGMDDYGKSSFILSEEGQVYMHNSGTSPYLLIAPNLIFTSCLFSVAGLLIGFLTAVCFAFINKRLNTLKQSSS